MSYKLIGLIFINLFLSINYLKSENQTTAEINTINKYFGRTIWSNGKKIIIRNNEITIFLPAQSVPVHLQAPRGSVWVTFSQESAWALTNENRKENLQKSDEPVIQRVWRSEDLTTWKAYGDLDTKSGPIRAIIPIDGDRFFIVPRSSFVFFNGAYSPFFLAGLNETGQLTFKEAVHLDLGEPFTLLPGHQAPVTSDFTKYQANPKYLIYKNLIFESQSPIYQINSGFFIGSMHMGIFWYFDDKGKLKKRYQLFDQMKDEDFANIWKFDRAILGCQVSPDHRLFIASRNKEAVFLGQTFYPSVFDQDKKIVEAELIKIREEKNRNSFPDIEWWEIDPSEASPKRISPPPFAPVDIRTIPTGKSVVFSFRPDGVMVFPSPGSGETGPTSLPTIPPSSPASSPTGKPQTLKPTKIENEVSKAPR